MARRLDYFFRETGSGLSRNFLVAFAAMSTTFIALLLLGMALLTQREVNLIVEATGGKVEVSVFLTDDISESQRNNLIETLHSMPEVKDVQYESKEQAYDRAKELFKDSPDILANLTPDALPASLRVKLNDPSQFNVIDARLKDQPGIEEIRDQHDILDKLFAATRIFRLGVFLIAVVTGLSAALLIANTVRIGLFARRREIGIMKLVGATNWFIRLPFLIEGIVEGIIGALFAIIALFIMKTLLINPLYGKITFFPWVQTSDVVAIVPILLVVGLAIALIASFAGMRRFLDV